MKHLLPLRILPVCLMLSLLGSVAELRASVGSDNPTGVAGIFNGNITTGCSYDPYTGNATRTVTDMVIAGAVGEYGLSLSRTFSSRNGWGHDFGMAGGWHHNYNWVIENSALSSTSGFQPSSYTVDFPDGRTETFGYSASDPGYYRATAGVRDRLQPLNLSTMLAYLVLPDGGQIEFKATQQTESDNCCPTDGCPLCTFYYYSYVPQAIIDPHGLRTSLTYNADGTLNKVTEPAGRYLQFYWLPVPGYNVIDHVTASDGRTVQYYYVTISPGGTAYTALDHIVYFGNSSWTAHYQYRAPNVGAAYGLPLLSTADDPMYSGPMHKIAYTYKTGTNPDTSAAVFGQIQSENYYDGTNVGVAVSTLSVTGTYTRTETRADGKTRTFTYQSGGYITSCTDFYSHSASQTYDANKYINAVTDRNGHITNYTCDAITGLLTQIQYPLTQGDTPGQSQRPTVNYTYTNNYYLHTSQDEGGHTTTYTRDGNNRVTRIDYPDTGYETFSYDAAHFYQLSTHRLTAGGTETFAYDTSHRLQYYSDAYHSNPSNFSIQYSYDGLDRVSGVTDALNQNTSFAYNYRGQVTVTTLPYYNGVRYTIVNTYNTNGDGTLVSVTDQLSHVTSYTYDDYRRLKSVTPPDRNDGTGLHTTHSYYDANGATDDYRYTDSNVTFVTLPSGKKTKTVYDDNRRKSTVTVGYLSGNDATTTYFYDNVGNLTKVENPRSYSTTTGYDERNRPSSITDALNRITSFTYDTAGHKKTITRPNGQVITYVSFDAMNRVLQQNATQTPTGLATTNFTYYPSGLLNTMQDPHLSSGSDNYTYAYDLMGRKQQVTYPLDSYSAHSTEHWTYDTDGRLYQFTNRGGYIQTFYYDQLNRISSFTWNDGITPGVTFGYDAASRLTSVNNANAGITRAYYNDNLLHSETETITGGYAKTVTYTYDGDGNRASTTYPTPESYGFNYSYNGRNQLAGVTNWAAYNYDENNYTGDLTSRVLTAAHNTSTYLYDPLDRVTWLTHTFTGSANRAFNYFYEDNSDNLKYVRRTGSTLGDVGDVFNYDLADQVTGVQLNVQTPETTPTPAPNVTYDPNGNLTTFHPPYVSYETYAAANDLNQYTTRTVSGVQATAGYDHKGNLNTDFDGSSYTYDAQNRLYIAPNATFKYDGLNRQVSRTIGGATTFSVWDGWDLIEEYQTANSGASTAVYLYGAGGLISGVTSGYFAYYFQDASGSTSHVTDANGGLLEWYRYDLQGAPVFYNSSDQQISASAYGVCYLFTGQQWRSELGLYDLRNRFYSPDVGRFLQTDPIDFDGDPTNLYRYCGNNPVAFGDPSGLWTFQIGWSFNINVLSTSWNFTAGVALDGHWNLGGFRTLYGGVGGAGARASTGLYLGASTAERISGLGKWYTNVNGGGGLGPSGAGQVFWGNDPSNNNKLVIGGGITLGGGVGGGGSGGPSYTWISRWWSPNPTGRENRPNVVHNATAHRVTSWNPAGENRVGPFGVSPFGSPFGPGGSGPWGGIGPIDSGPLGDPMPPPDSGPITGPDSQPYEPGPVEPYWQDPQDVPGWDPTFDVGPLWNESLSSYSEGCFVAGTPILMADGSSKPIENIQVGEPILAWNEETKQIFSTKVISALHHEEKMQTLFDIDLEDGRTFTVNNDHPMYVVEDGDFIFTRELAARFANGETITFQDSNERPIKVASLRMRTQRCKVYNLHVEGQGNNGHTYYVNGILAHNEGAGNILK